MNAALGPSRLNGFRQGGALLVVQGFASSFPLRCPSTGQRCQLVSARRLTTQHLGLFRVILTPRAYANIAYRIWSNIATASHAVAIHAEAALVPFATIYPDGRPFLKREQERNASLFGAVLMVPVASLQRISCSPSSDYRCVFLSTILGISHLFLLARDMVRGGASAETPTPSRLYHALPQGAY